MVRRRLGVGAVLALTGACTAPTVNRGGDTAGPEKPAQPITLTILDGGGDLATNKLLIGLRYVNPADTVRPF
ncbi:hypothetical protein MOQ72_34485 [Saccharopolyspora sp. K220]|uniref:hypothetical protein n=1 Tax=Saccharopolyspora soli TaxID=2926618 RepID=UPI001F59792C|nr:hypothetical protein [Saccharopolyspora soli]MCI2422548.1 hypothetical protein [Saccharopolyspora soli]